MEYDVIIVGAGPAGTAAAIVLARTGKSVLIVDSAPFPREKACGDGILPEAASILAELDVLPKVLSGPCQTIAHITVHAPSGTSLKVTIKPQSPDHRFLMISRFDFDNILLQKALDCGATFLRDRVTTLLRNSDVVSGVRVQNHGKSKSIYAKTVIGADGSSSVVRRNITGKRPPVDSIAIRAYLEPYQYPVDSAEFFFTPDLFPGYAWVFPLSATRANIGLGLDLARYRKTAPGLKTLLQSFLLQPDVSGLVKSEARIVSRKSGAYWFIVKHPSPVAYPGVLLTGDAAGFMDPLSGEGIRNALLSGKIAGEVINQFRERAFSAEQLSEAYSNRIQQEILPGLARSLRIQQRFLRSPRRFNRLIGGARWLYPLVRPWLSRFSTNFIFE
ncbi:MAG: geranylgeranyl reductase family protein [FCB group bacterium]|nr:geranylgeranyl reductase family protein [FCB group bacterium]